MILFRSLVFNIFFILWTALAVIIMSILLVFPRNIMASVVTIWALILAIGLRVIVGLSFEVRGLNNIVDGNAIYAAKHQSAWDTFIYFLILKNPSYILKKELLSIPLWGWCAKRYGAIPIDRKGGGSALKEMILNVEDRLKKNMSIIIFPEGTRTLPKEKNSYHSGIAAIYKRLNVPIIPVAVNSGVFWGRRQFKKYPGTIILQFLPIIEPGYSRNELMEQLACNIEEASNKLVEEAILEYPELERFFASEERLKP